VADDTRSPNQGNRLATHSQNFATLDPREPAHHNDPPADDDAGKFELPDPSGHLLVILIYCFHSHRQNEYVYLPPCHDRPSISSSIHIPFPIPITGCPTNCSAISCDYKSYGTLPICLDSFLWPCGNFGSETAVLTLNYSEGYLQLRQAPQQDPRSLQTLRVSRHKPPDLMERDATIRPFGEEDEGRCDVRETDIDKRIFQQSPVSPQPEEDLRLVRLPGCQDPQVYVSGIQLSGSPRAFPPRVNR